MAYEKKPKTSVAKKRWAPVTASHSAAIEIRAKGQRLKGAKEKGSNAPPKALRASALDFDVTKLIVLRELSVTG